VIRLSLQWRIAMKQDQTIAATLTAALIQAHFNLVHKNGGDTVQGAVDLYYECLDKLRKRRPTLQAREANAISM
jgi:hypothetical protein